MSSNNIDDLSSALASTRVTPSGVSFAGKSLKLNTEDDAKTVVEEIDKCTNLEYLNLEGNTLGVDASKGIAKALEKHPELKRALWKDMFTGRMKTEIPKALEFLGSGLQVAGARLTELDLSDNAFGPIGVEGLAALLRSSSCYALEELRLNNNGLGITGGKLLAAALTDCYNCSKNEGKPLALKVFIAGRNRLENEGAKALAAVFKTMGTLEEIVMPQNGIYHPGISALSDAFVMNKNLKTLNLNDNTIGEKGAEAIAKALPSLQDLREINFGDCLLKTKGAILLANGLKDGHSNLEDVNLGHNEIRLKGGLQLVRAMSNKNKLKVLNINGNQFGEDGRSNIEDEMKNIGKANILGSLSENESEESEEEQEVGDQSDDENNSSKDEQSDESYAAEGSIENFLNSPTASNLLKLTEKDILKAVKVDDEIDLDKCMHVLMKISGLNTDSKENASKYALKCSEMLYSELFSWAEKKDNLPLVNNTVLVYLGLIKHEDKKFKITWNLEACCETVKCVLQKGNLPKSTEENLTVFLKLKDKS